SDSCKKYRQTTVSRSRSGSVRTASRSRALRSPEPWTRADGDGPGLAALAHVGGRLVGLTRDGALLVRTRDDDGWAPLGTTPGLTTLTGTAGRLVGATPGGDLFWRELAGGTTGGTTAGLPRIPGGDPGTTRSRTPAGGTGAGRPRAGREE
ncbi:hypothetical protein, partial [Streptosporangium sp. NPDC048865]|uniref:hypothetical protein n=1 Tax=Streptosporangium sp. NPDC048865 TaxID=3155766 RepID=UPI0034209637